jgi:hypothetical protein
MALPFEKAPDVSLHTYPAFHFIAAQIVLQLLHAEPDAVAIVLESKLLVCIPSFDKCSYLYSGSLSNGTGSTPPLDGQYPSHSLAPPPLDCHDAMHAVFAFSPLSPSITEYSPTDLNFFGSFC